MEMKRDSFFFEFIKSGPFLTFIILVLLILLGIAISNRHSDTVKMKEDVLYILPEKK